MATHVEVFRADISLNLKGIADSIKELNKLNVAAKDLTKTLEGLGSVKVSFRQVNSDLDNFKQRIDEIGFTIGERGGLLGNSIAELRQFGVIFQDVFGDIEQVTERQMNEVAAIIGSTTKNVRGLFDRLKGDQSGLFDPAVDSARDASHEIVGGSIIPDMIKEIDLEFKKLPSSFNVQARKLEADFQVFKDQLANDIRIGDLQGARETLQKIEELKFNLRELQRVGTFSDTRGLTGRDLADKLGVTELFFNIESGIRRLKDKTTPEVQAFRQELINFRAEFKQLDQVGGPSINRIQSEMGRLATQFDRIQSTDIVESIAKGIQDTENKSAAAAQKQQGRDDKRSAKIAEITGRINTLREAGQRETGILTQGFQGLSLALTQPGLRLQGLREAFVGTNASSNLLIRGIDRLIGGTDNLVAANNKLVASAANISKEVSRSVGSLKNQANQFRLLTQAELGNVDASEELNKRLTKVRASFDQVVVTAESGGDISRALIRARTEARQLQNEYQQLVSSGILPMGSESEKAFREIIRQSQNAEAGLVAVSSRYNATKVEAERMADAAKKTGDEIERQERAFAGLFSVLGRVGTGLRGLFTGFRQAEADARGLEEGMERDTKAAQALTSQLNTLRTVLLSVLSGGAAGLLGGLTAGGLPNLGSFFTFGSDVAADAKRLTAALGEPIEVAGRFGQVIKDVYTDAFGSSVHDVSVATQVAALSMTRFGEITDEVLEKNVENLFRLNDTFNTDHQDTMDAAATLVESFGLEWDQAFDFITGGLQQGLNRSGDFLDTIREYSNQFAASGATSDQFFSILDTGLAGGVLGTDKAADTFKEFANRILDGSKTTTDALSAIGVNSDDLLTGMADGTISVVEAFEFVIAQLRNVEDQSVLSQAGFDLFGTQAEDLRGVLANLTTTEIPNLAGATAGLDIQYQTFGTQLESIKRSFIAAFDTTPLLAALTQVTGPLATFAGTLGIFTTNIVTSFNSAIGSVRTFIDNVLFGTGEITGVFANMVAAVASLLGGDFALATDFATQAVIALVDNIGVILGNLVSQGFDYGFSFMVELGNGIVDAAVEVVNAVISVISQISDFLAPGSPPKKGPLSQIDDWGKGTFESYLEGFNNADLDFISKALDPIAQSLGERFDEGVAVPKFDKVKDSLAQLVTEMNNTGEINETIFSQIEKTIGNKKVSKELRAQIEARAGISAASQKVADAERAIAEAAEQGFVPAELQNKLAIAQAELKTAEQQGQEEEKRKRTLDSLASSEEKLLDAQSGVAAGAAAVGGAVGKATSAIKAQQKIAGDSYRQQIADLEALRDAGGITQEEFLKKRIQIESQWLKNTENNNKQETISKIVELKKQLAEVEATRKAETAALKDAQKEQSKLLSLGTATIDKEALFPKIDLVQSAKDTAEVTATSFIDGLKGRIASAGTGLFESLKGLFTESFGRFINFAKDPANFGVASALIGGVITILGSPVLAAITSTITGLISALGGLGVILRFVVGRALAFTIPGALVLGLLLNWDEVVAFIGPLFLAFGQILADVAVEVSALLVSLQQSGALEGTLSNLTRGFGLLFTAAAKILSLIKGPIEQIVIGLTVVGTVLGTVITRFLEAFGGGQEFGRRLGEVFLELSRNFKEFGQLVNVIIDNIISFGTNAASVSSILDNFDFSTTIQFLKDMGIAFFNILPPGLQSALLATRDAIVAFFDEGRLGNEIILLLTDVFQLLSSIIFDNKDTWLVLGAAIAGIIGFIIDAGVSSLQTFIDIWPFLEGAITGVIEIIRGIITIFDGLVTSLGAVGAFVIGFFTGDFTEAFRLGAEAGDLLNEGIALVFEGVLDTIINAGAAIVVSAVSFATNMVENVFGVFNIGVPTWLESFFEAKDTFVEVAVTLVNDVTTTIGTMIDRVLAVLNLDSWADIFWGLYDIVVGNSIIPDMVTAIVEWLTVTLVDQVLAGLGSFVDSVLSVLTLENIIAAFQFMSDTITQNIIPFLAEFVSSAFAGLVAAIIGINLQPAIDLFAMVKDEIVNNIIPILTSTVQTGFETIANFASSVDLSAAVSALLSFKDTIVTDVIPAVVTFIQDNLGAAIEFIQNISLQSVINTFLNLRDIIVNEAIPGIITFVQDQFGAVVSFLSTIDLQAVKDIFFGLRDAITADAIPAIVSFVQEQFGVVLTFLSNINLQSAIDAFINIKDAIIGSVIPELVSFVLTKFGEIIIFITGLDLTPVETAFMTMKDNILATLAGLGETFWNWLTITVLPQALTRVSELAIAVSEAISGQWTVIQTALGNWALMFWDWLTTTALPQAGPKISEIATAIGTAVDAGWTTIQATLSNWGAMFWDWVLTATGNVGASLQPIVDSIITWATGITETDLSNFGQIIGQGLASAVLAATSTIISVGSSIVDLVISGISNLLSASATVQDAGGSIIDNVITGLTTFQIDQARITAVLDTIGNILSAAAIGLATIIGVGATILAGILEGFLNGITDGGFEAAGITELGGVLSGIGENLQTIVVTIGEGMVDGIVDGIKSKPGELKEALLENIQGGVDSVTSFLGLKSPSKLFFGFGQDVIAGLEGGIQQEGAALPSTLQSITGNLIGAAQNVLGNLGSIFSGGAAAQAPVQGTATQDIAAIQQAFTLAQQTITAGIMAIGLAWTMLTMQMNLEWTNLWLLMTTILTNWNLITFTPLIQMITIQWTTFLMNVQLQFQNTFILLTATLLAFQESVIASMTAIGEAITEVINLFIALGETALASGEAIASSSENAVEGLNKLKPILQQLIILLDKLKTAAEAAASAINGIGGAASSAGLAVPGAQHGAYRTREGLIMVHDDEMILPRDVANTVRNLVSSLRSTGIGGAGVINPNVSTFIPAAVPVSESFDSGGGNQGRDGDTFIANIYNQEDEEKFFQKIKRARRQETRGF